MKQFYVLRNLRNNILRFIEIKSHNIYTWAWNKRNVIIPFEKWNQGYKEWKKNNKD